MRILILGVSGLIGHRLFLELSNCFDTYGILHKSRQNYGKYQNLFSKNNIIDNIDVRNFEMLQGVFSAINPDVILNCVGITKRKDDINHPITALEVNSILPHRLANWATQNNKRIIHFSTDCVFDGTAGNYNEDSLTTATDIYGRTKAFGELRYDNTLTLRSSFIGQELFEKSELLEWLLAQDGKQILGYTNVFYSGVSTIFMARVIKILISEFPYLSGLYQLATEKPISKFELLGLARDFYKVNVSIIPEGNTKHLPTLDGTKLKDKLQLIVPPWSNMMAELAQNREFYSGVWKI